MTSRTHWWPVALVLLALSAATSCSEPAPKTTGTNTTSTTLVADCGPTQLLQCARRSTLCQARRCPWHCERS